MFRSNTDIGNMSVSSTGANSIIGDNCIIIGGDAFTFGNSNVVLGNYGHAEGKYTCAAWGAHAENAANEALGECSHAQGRVNRAKGKYSMAAGVGNTAKSDNSIAFGAMSIANDDCSFVWNGKQLSGYQGIPSAKYNYSYPGNWVISVGMPANDKNSLEYI